ncbi:MAG: RAMP superfamily CRISPR-associated protein, partial [Blastocatellia bacterium]
PDDKGPRMACEVVYSEQEARENLCPTCKVFGAPGWRSPLAMTAFTPAPVQQEAMSAGIAVEKQEFLAIDRFTGGGAKGLKFNATSRYQPVLDGTLSLDLRALDRAGAGGWAIALLTLTLRDLMEGDIRLGFGAAKGYGSLTAEIRNMGIPSWEQLPEWITAELANNLFPASKS